MSTGVRAARASCGQVLAEVNLELLHAFDHGENHVARAGAGEMGGAEGGHAVIDGLAQSGLYAGGRVLGGHGAPVIERAAHQDGGGGNGHERKQRT
jgi:hypothetical protein